MTDEENFWELPDTVQKFAARPADLRLVELIKSFEQPESIRVLDLGCAAGRNAVILAEQGFDLFAMDASRAMVEKTRERVAPVLGQKKAQERVRVGKMGDLGAFQAGFFHLVVALGVFHCATHQEQWDHALSETARVLMPGGQVLVAHFSPRSDPAGQGLRKVKGEKHLYDGIYNGRHYLLEAETLDAEMARFGLVPVVATRTVTVETDPGRRVTANALYRKKK